MGRDWYCNEEIRPNPDELSVWSMTSQNGVAKSTLELGLFCNVKDLTLHITVYCPFWMINNTGLLLVYKVNPRYHFRSCPFGFLRCRIVVGDEFFFSFLVFSFFNSLLPCSKFQLPSSHHSNPFKSTPTPQLLDCFSHRWRQTQWNSLVSLILRDLMGFDGLLVDDVLSYCDRHWIHFCFCVTICVSLYSLRFQRSRVSRKKELARKLWKVTIDLYQAFTVWFHQIRLKTPRFAIHFLFFYCFIIMDE